MAAVAQNVLYVTSEGAWLSKDHGTIVVSIEGKKRAQIPMLQLEGVVLFGAAGMTPDLMGSLVEAGISVSFFSRSDRFHARVEGVPGGNVLLRRAQHRIADDAERSAALARAFVIGKVANTRRYLRRGAREAIDDGARAILEAAADQVARVAASLARSSDVDALRGLEGSIASSYWGAFPSLIKNDDEGWRFGGRSKRPPRDRMNALLSFGYALLQRDCTGALAAVGLDPAVGYLHVERPGRMSLALDLMEELRIPVVDRLALAMVNRAQLGPRDLVSDEGQGWRLTDAARKEFLVAYQTAKQAQVRHVFLEQDTTWGMVPHWQARILARALRGDLETYVPFEMPG